MRRFAELLGLVILLFVILYLATLAGRYGAIWNLQHRPVQDVQVTLSDGTYMTGALSRDWSGDWLLVTSEGKELHFPIENRLIMRIPAAESDVSFWENWRTWLPFSLVWLVGSFVFFKLCLALVRICFSALSRGKVGPAGKENGGE